jgi:hypothetical protein
MIDRWSKPFVFLSGPNFNVSACSARRISGEDREDDKRHQIEQNDSYLEDAHSSVVKRIELVMGQVKPSAMDALNPIMGEYEDQEPHQQYSVVDNGTPQKNVAGDFDGHLPAFGI